jgi:hypothetical protein
MTCRLDRDRDGSAALQLGKAMPYRRSLDTFGGYASSAKKKMRHSLKLRMNLPGKA